MSLRHRLTNQRQDQIAVCFTGNPNVGKSSWINLLSQSSVTVGNYPGVTVAVKKIETSWREQPVTLIDLPGMYSLYHGTNEELIARDFLLKESVDVIVNVVDTTNFSRCLPLLLELRELQIPMLILLNYRDEAIAHNIEIDLEQLQQLLQIKAIFTSARIRRNDMAIDEIRDTILMLGREDKSICRHPLGLKPQDLPLFEQVLSFIKTLALPYDPITDAKAMFYAIKWCEQDAYVIEELQKRGLPLKQGYALLEDINASLIPDYREQLMYRCRQCVHMRKDRRLFWTNRIDAVLLHRYAAIPLFLAIMFALLYTVYWICQPLTVWLDQFINHFLSYYAGKLFSFLPPWQIGLIQKGLIQGVGGTIVFLPMLAGLFLAVSFLEECGYLARIAFMFDRIMRPFGMSGRSFVSLLLGSGCNVPAILSTRTLDQAKARWITALLIPFISCTARLPIYLVFASAFFPKRQVLTVMTLYALGGYVGLLFVYVLNRLIKVPGQSLFTLELPPYRWPSISLLFHKVFWEIKSFLRKSFTVITSSMIILYLVSSLPSKQDSYLYRAASAISPVFEPLGFGNRIELIAALPGAVISKENVIGFLDLALVDETFSEPLLRTFSYDLKKQVKLLGKTAKDMLSLNRSMKEESGPLVKAISELWHDEYKELRAFSYLAYVLLSVPCVMTLHALRQEIGWKGMMLSLLSMLLLPYCVSFLLFQGFSRIFS